MSNLINPYLFDDSQALADAFEARVLADGGLFEGESCLVSQLQLLRSLGGLYSQASLILTPNGYKEGKMYSLKPTSGAGDFSFTRAGTAYRKGPSLVETVPYNLLQRSEEFDNAVWILGGGTSIVANAATDPNGNLTADLISESNITSNFAALQSVAKSAVVASYTFSVYIKPAGRTWAIIQIYDGTSDAIHKYFDVQNGIVGSTSITGSSLTLQNATITQESNGYFKCVVTVLMNTTTAIRSGVFTALSDGGGTIHAGSAGIGLYVWGAQTVVGSSVKNYQRTTNRQNFPRPDYELGSCPAWLVEPQRTNICLRSEEVDAASWLKLQSSATANATTAPDGVSTADKLTELASINFHYIEQQFSATISGFYTASAYFKAAERGVVILTHRSGDFLTTFSSVLFDITNGVIVAGANTFGSQYSAVDVGNGWWRVNVTSTGSISSQTNTRLACLIMRDTSTASYLGVAGNGLYMWGFQLEAGSFATSYIPTTSGSVTRIADAVTALSGVSSLIGQTEGTLFIDFYNMMESSTDNYASINDGTVNNRIRFGVSGFSGNVALCLIVAGGVTQASFTSGAFGVRSRVKIAVVYRANYAAFFVNGVKIGEDLSVNVPACSVISLDQTGGTSPIRGNLNLYMIMPTALSDANAILLTT